jgi:hypothetical protein
MRARTSSKIVLGLALAALAVWRAVCVRSGPDIDTDAYAHHMIARGILADPHDLAIHWVWLPLFHYLQVPLVAAGGTMDAVRWANVALSAAVPWVLFAYVARTTHVPRNGTAWTSSSDAIALLAAVFAAACPIAMQMGTTAQPEPLFALLMLGTAITFQEGRFIAASLMLGTAVLLRYEAWASLLTIAGVLAVEEFWKRARGRTEERGPGRGWIVVAVPVALILAWAALRRPVDGKWFGFLGQTREFATGATHQQTALDEGILGLARDVLYYPAIVPFRVLGPVALLVPFGVVRTVRCQGARFVLVLGACLAFVSFSWVMRSSLGLDRHFVVVVPLYATFAAQGVATISGGAVRLLRRITGPASAQRAGGAIAAAAAGGALVGLAVQLHVWMGYWRDSIVRGWPDRVAVGDYLRSIPGDPTIFCDDATIEILSGLDRRRFDRHWVDDGHTWSLIAEVARTRGVAYVATWTRKLVDHEDDGEIVFRAGLSPDDRRAGLSVMRVPLPVPPGDRHARR